MKLEIQYSVTPIRVLDDLEPVEIGIDFETIEVYIDDKLCPKSLRDIIMAGLFSLAGNGGKTFAEISEEYLRRK